MRILFNSAIVAALAMGAAFALAPDAFAASCCGGGSSSSLILPKFAKSMIDISVDSEKYYGYWDKDGKYLTDPPGSDLRQYRLNLGYARRLASRWQASLVVPVVRNQNKYANSNSENSGVGDTVISLWYETFDDVLCLWKVKKLSDLKPAIYLGTSLTTPTGVSPYDGVSSSFDVTGRGLYRLDASLLMDKTIYPWNVSLLYSYGIHFERPVNREYGSYVEPYQKDAGDRSLMTLSGGYTHFMESMNTLTGTLAYSDLKENSGTINGDSDPATGLRKRSVAFTLAFSSFDKDWIYKLNYNHAIQQDNWGESFPVTDIVTVGVTHVFR